MECPSLAVRPRGLPGLQVSPARAALPPRDPLLLFSRSFLEDPAFVRSGVCLLQQQPQLSDHPMGNRTPSPPPGTCTAHGPVATVVPAACRQQSQLRPSPVPLQVLSLPSWGRLDRMHDARTFSSCHSLVQSLMFPADAA